MALSCLGLPSFFSSFVRKSLFINDGRDSRASPLTVVIMPGASSNALVKLDILDLLVVVALALLTSLKC